MDFDFIDRETEMESLDELYRREGAQCLILWEAQAMLLGEARWTRKAVGMPVLEGLKKKVTSVVPGSD